ncbi:50S ribosomal protein L1 [Candidatus Daviesbacteria bacterium]|nr:50S ribosomal protein L1 [Candidatus Daviesbacteria bacterium]
MGKTKTKLIDDSLPQDQEVKKEAPKSKPKDELVEKLKAELGIGAEEPQRKPEPKTVTSSETKQKEEKKPAKQKTQAEKSKPRSKKYQEAVKDLDKSKTYPLTEAIELTKKFSYTKFNGTLEAHINTHHAGIRGLVSLPFATGKKLTILAFGKGADQSGADLVGDEATIEEVSKGKINFDLVVTTPEWMPKLAKVAKNLGPRGLMPNPKNGTITDDLKKAVGSFQAGKTEFKTESKAAVIHIGLGKLNQPTQELAANIKTLFMTIGKTKVKKLSLTPTMGPSVKVDLASI